MTFKTVANVWRISGEGAAAQPQDKRPRPLHALTFTDPFGLCKAGDPDWPHCKNGGRVQAVGFTFNAIMGAGPTASFGVYTNELGSGHYLKVGWGTGLDVSGGVDVSTADSLGTFAGEGEAYCGGAFGLNGCNGSAYGKPETKSNSRGVALGPTELLKVSGHAEYTHTFASKPVPGNMRCGDSYCPTVVK